MLLLFVYVIINVCDLIVYIPHLYGSKPYYVNNRMLVKARIYWTVCLL